MKSHAIEEYYYIASRSGLFHARLFFTCPFIASSLVAAVQLLVNLEDMSDVHKFTHTYEASKVLCKSS
jgi:hypothetical protein